MASSDRNADKLAVCMEESGTGPDTPGLHQNNPIASDERGVEDNRNPCRDEALNTSNELKFELETLTIERERLKKENRRLAEMLEGIKLEEDIAILKEEVGVLGEEKEQILIEIQRRKQSMAINVSHCDTPTSSNDSL
jgi:hypothetical protein